MSWFLILLVVVAGYLLLRPLGVQEWDTTSYPVPDGDHDIGVAQAEIQAGLEAIRTDYYGTTDPSTGASWGADQLGTTWHKSTNAIGAGGDDLGGELYVWAVLTATPTYGWRLLNLYGFVPVEPNVNALNVTGQSSDGSWQDLDLSGTIGARATRVQLAVTVKDSGTPASTVFAEFRKDGITDARTLRVIPQASGVENTVVLELEVEATTSVVQRKIAASGSNTFDLRVDILGYWQRAS